MACRAIPIASSSSQPMTGFPASSISRLSITEQTAHVTMENIYVAESPGVPPGYADLESTRSVPIYPPSLVIPDPGERAHPEDVFSLSRRTQLMSIPGFPHLCAINPRRKTCRRRGSFAELGCEEYFSSKLLIDLLKEHNFRVEANNRILTCILICAAYPWSFPCPAAFRPSPRCSQDPVPMREYRSFSP